MAPSSRSATRRPGVQHRLQLTQLRRSQLALGPASAFRAQGLLPASVRRHRFADIRDTRNRRATSRSLAPALISSAAANRTCSRQARSAAVSPPPSGYLMVPA